jgi:hypothetical protein
MADLVKLLDDASDVSPCVLAVTGDVISDWHPVGAQLVQAAAGIRAANTVRINRRNVTNQIALVITKAPAASPLAAKQAAAALIVAITAKLATFTLLDVELNGEIFRLSDAALDSYDLHPRGTTVVASYQFSGGALAEVP